MAAICLGLNVFKRIKFPTDFSSNGVDKQLQHSAVISHVAWWPLLKLLSLCPLILNNCNSLEDQLSSNL